MKLKIRFLALFACVLALALNVVAQSNEDNLIIDLNKHELLQKLYILPVLTDITPLDKGEFNEKYELFVTQPVDHRQSEAGTFKQRVFVCHVGFDRPTLIVTEGYGAEYAKNARYREELSRLFNMNIIVVEYRYFLKSIPSPLNWDYLTVENSMYDLHNIRTLFGTIYKGKWASTGVSKGGQTTMFYRAFFPNDVDVSVPYVAPLNKAVVDGRHEKFIAKQVGTPEERLRVLNYQLEVLKRKPTLMPLFKAHCEANNFRYRCPVEEVYDYCVMEYAFALWQYGTPISSIPNTDADDEALFRHLLDVSNPMYFSYITPYSAFDVQAARELGYYGYDTTPFKGLLTLKTTKDYLRRLMVPDGQENIKFQKALYQKTHKYLLKEDPKMLFIYGSIDPWTASGVTNPTYFKNKQNMKCFIEEGASHRVKIGTMSPENRSKILHTLSTWLGEPVAENSSH